VILGFPSYLRHIAIVAKEEMGFDSHSHGRTLGSHLGQEDRARIEPVSATVGTFHDRLRYVTQWRTEQTSGCHLRYNELAIVIRESLSSERV
jgi:hypothetical protein